MARHDPMLAATDDGRSALEAENRLLRAEIRVAREAAEITAKLVVQQFEKSEAMLARLQQSNVITETTLRENKGIMDNASFGICFTRDRKLFRYNKAFGEMFGFPGESGVGQPGRVLYPSDEAYAEVGRLAAPLLVRNQPFENEMLLRRQDGTDFWANVKAYVADPGDTAIGTVWIVQDRTTFKVAEAEIQKSNGKLRDSYEELEAANQRLQELDKLKSDFLSSVSHELRTPLTSIRGFATLIDREFSRSFMPLAGDDAGLQKKSQRIRGNLEILLKESARLTRLINDVLDLAKIEAGRTDWHDAPIQPEALLRDAVNAAHGMFEAKPAVSLYLEVQAGLPSFIGDADRMLQVLVNLLNNAAKFTERGTVTVKAFLNQDKLIQLDVCDTGVGFPAHEAEAIFDKFQQAKHGDTLADRPAGTGLGLAISREIVARHGGCIWATSEPGRGSVFSLTLLPAEGSLFDTTAIASRIVALAGHGVTGDAASPDLSGSAGKPRVLVVDDDPGVRGYLTQLLQEQDCDVISAADGQAAITAAQNFRPDLITMDLAMPVMDGRTAIIKLRADPALQHIPIMVISAIPGWETAGGDLSMGKPLDESRFLENIHLLLGCETSPVSRKVRFLVLHETSESPEMTPGSFSANCEADFCPLDELPARIQSGFQGMVVIPTHLLGKVDLSMLQATPLLEVMIMPIQSGQPLRSEMKFAE